MILQLIHPKRLSTIAHTKIKKQLPSYGIVLSKPIIRHDDGKANLAIRNVNKYLSALQLECIENDNISFCFFLFKYYTF